MVTRAIGGVLGAVSTLFLIAVIGSTWRSSRGSTSAGWRGCCPPDKREDFYITGSRMGATMRRLMAGRIVGMVFEGILTWLMLWVYGVPMAVLLGILTGLLAFIPNLGALMAGALMVLVGFSGGTDMGLYTVFVYFLVQTFDGWVVIPLIAKKTVDLAPALVLAAQLIMSLLFGVLGLFLADPAVGDAQGRARAALGAERDGGAAAARRLRADGAQVPLRHRRADRAVPRGAVRAQSRGRFASRHRLCAHRRVHRAGPAGSRDVRRPGNVAFATGARPRA
jgi:hypothetical protein